MTKRSPGKRKPVKRKPAKPKRAAGSGRPHRVPHRLEDKLRDHVSAHTCAVYGRVFYRIETAGLPAAEWLRDLIAEKARVAKDMGKPSLSMSKKTLSVYRGAVAWYIHLVEQPEKNRIDIAASLPSAGPLREGKERPHLDTEQLARFRKLSESADEPARTVLLLLPLTGCRISEICYLERGHVDARRRSITVLGKFRKLREVMLGDVAWSLLTDYLSGFPALGDYVFMVDMTEGGSEREPRPFHPRDAWFAVQRWTKDRAPGGLLHGVCLHQLRHTVATTLVQGGVSLKTAQDTLGHKDISTLGRYVHPSEEEKRAAMKLLEPEESEDE